MGLVILLMGAALLAAVLTYDPLDPSLNNATGRAANNLLGNGGALLADLALQSIGAASLAVPPVLAAWSWALFQSGRLARWRWRLVALPALLWLLCLSLAGLGTPESWPLASGLEGVVGQLSLARLSELSFLASSSHFLAPGAALLGALGYAWLLGLSLGQWYGIGRGMLWLVVAAKRGVAVSLGFGKGQQPFFL